MALVQYHRQSEETGAGRPKVKARQSSELEAGLDPYCRYNKLHYTKKSPTKGVFTKKPTGLEKKSVGPKYPANFVNSKYQKYQKYQKPQKVPAKKVRLAPIPDLRPTSIDRIDILRWGNQFIFDNEILFFSLFQTTVTKADG